MQKLLRTTLWVFVCLFIANHAKAVRPFITDDARVVGFKLFQWETWWRADRDGFQSWHMFAYGPHKNIELTLGAAVGADFLNDERGKQRFTGAAPLLQAKFLFNEYRPNKMPGFSFAAGTFLPFGTGELKPPGHGTFGMLMVTQSFLKNDGILIHGNVGYNYLRIGKTNDIKPIWGVGTQIHTYKGFHLVAEVFSGDPYVSGAGTAFQGGFRHFVSDLIQIDMTVGKGFGGSNPMPIWSTAGVRMVTEYFLNKGKKKPNKV